MNKIMVIPMGVGFLCLFVALLGGLTQIVNPVTDSWTSDTGDANGTVTINGTSQTVNVPNAGEQNFTILSSEGLMVLLGIGIAVGIVSGISFLGSGLSEMSQRMIFVVAIFLGLWGVLTLAMYQMIQEVPELGFIAWLILTAMYLIGMSEYMVGD